MHQKPHLVGQQLLAQCDPDDVRSPEMIACLQNVVMEKGSSVNPFDFVNSMEDYNAAVGRGETGWTPEMWAARDAYVGPAGHLVSPHLQKFFPQADLNRLPFKYILQSVADQVR